MSKIICRLCLQAVSENYQEIGDSLKRKLKLNMGISKNIVACMECTSNLQIFLTLKSVCGDMREKSLLLAELSNNVTLNSVNPNHLKSAGKAKDEISCSFCTKSVGQEILIPLRESKQNMFMLDMLDKYIPELNIRNTDEFLTCQTCLNGLQSVSNFLMNFYDVEEKISEYMEIKGIYGKEPIDLQDVQQFRIEQTLKFEGQVNALGQTYDQNQENYTIKVETEIDCKIEVDDINPTIKTEDIDIKSEQSDCDSIQESTTGVKLDNDPLRLQLYKCELCPFETKYNSSFKRHALTHKKYSIDTTLYKCEMCTYETINKYRLDDHVLTHKSRFDIEMFKCELCAFETKRKPGLKRHMFVVHANIPEVKSYKCEMCTYVTKCKLYLNRHKLSHKSLSEVTIFKCEMCSYKTKLKGSLRTHMLIHKSPSEVKMYKCDDCTYETNRKSSLMSHILIHKDPSEMTMFKCGLCTFEAKRKGELNQHVLIVHKNPSILYKCDSCTYKTKRNDYLNRHMLVHRSPTEVTMFGCEICEFKTKRKYNLKTHMLLHKIPSELTLYECETCTFKTKFKTNLNKHKLIHK